MHRDDGAAEIVETPADIDMGMAGTVTPVAASGTLGAGIITSLGEIVTSLARMGGTPALVEALRVLIKRSHSVPGTTLFLSRTMRLRANDTKIRPGTAHYFAAYSEDGALHDEDGGWYSEGGDYTAKTLGGAARFLGEAWPLAPLSGGASPWGGNPVVILVPRMTHRLQSYDALRRRTLLRSCGCF